MGIYFRKKLLGSRTNHEALLAGTFRFINSAVDSPSGSGGVRQRGNFRMLRDSLLCEDRHAQPHHGGVTCGSVPGSSHRLGNGVLEIRPSLYWLGHDSV